MELSLLIILFGPIWIVVALIVSASIIGALENESTGLASFLLIVFLAFSCFGTQPSLIKVAAPFWWQICLTYIVCGATYGLAKWYFYSKKKLRDYERTKSDWLFSRGITSGTEVPTELKEKFREHLIYAGFKVTVWKDGKCVSEVEVRPRPWKHKERILTWMAFWPWSFVWSFVEDFLMNIFRHIQDALSNMMDGISKSVFKNTEKDYQ